LENNTIENNEKPFYGYWVLLAVIAGVFIYAGCGLYAFSFFVKPIQAEMNWDRSSIVLGYTIWSLSLGLVSPFVGRLVDRFGGRWFFTLGAVTTGLGFTILSNMHSVTIYWIAYAVVGIGMAALGQVPASAVVSHWFVKRRGLAIGIMSAAVGIGGLIVSPILGGLIIPSFGWRQAYFYMGLFACILVLPLSIFVIRNKPVEKGLHPDGIASIENIMKTHSETQGLSLAKALVTPAFWLIAACFLMSQLAQNGVMQTHVLYLSDLGFSATLTASMMGVIGMMSAAGKFSFGWLCDILKAKYTLAIGLALQLGGILLLLNIKTASPLSVVWVYSIIWGFGIGSWLPTMSMLVSSNFGLAGYSAIFGVMSLMNGLGSAFGPLLSSYVFDTTGVYRLAFIIFLVLFAISIPLILCVRKPKTDVD